MMIAVGYDGSKCRGNPLAMMLAHENCFFEFDRSRKVDRAQELACRQRSVIGGNTGVIPNSRTTKFAFNVESFKRGGAPLY